MLSSTPADKEIQALLTGDYVALYAAEITADNGICDSRDTEIASIACGGDCRNSADNHRHSGVHYLNQSLTIVSSTRFFTLEEPLLDGCAEYTIWFVSDEKDEAPYLDTPPFSQHAE